MIGVGTVSQMMHLPILSGLRDMYEITAVSDVSPSQLKHIADTYQAKAYADPYELVKDPNVDAVFICSPDQYHADYALAAVEAGKHVFVEKAVKLGAVQQSAQGLVNVYEPSLQTIVLLDRLGLLDREVAGHGAEADQAG